MVGSGHGSGCGGESEVGDDIDGSVGCGSDAGDGGDDAGEGDWCRLHALLNTDSSGVFDAGELLTAVRQALRASAMEAVALIEILYQELSKDVWNGGIDVAELVWRIETYGGVALAALREAAAGRDSDGASADDRSCSNDVGDDGGPYEPAGVAAAHRVRWSGAVFGGPAVTTAALLATGGRRPGSVGWRSSRW